MSSPIYCTTKVLIPRLHAQWWKQEAPDGWSFCDLPPGHEGPHSFHLHGERADVVVSSQLERLSKLEALLLEARNMLRSNPKASKLVKQMNEVLP